MIGHHWSKCTVPGCNGSAYLKAVCKKCYGRIYKGTGIGKNAGHPLTDEQKKEIRLRISKFQNAKTISKEMQVSLATVHRLMKGPKGA